MVLNYYMNHNVVVYDKKYVPVKLGSLTNVKQKKIHEFTNFM